MQWRASWTPTVARFWLFRSKRLRHFLKRARFAPCRRTGKRFSGASAARWKLHRPIQNWQNKASQAIMAGRRFLPAGLTSRNLCACDLQFLATSRLGRVWAVPRHVISSFFQMCCLLECTNLGAVTPHCPMSYLKNDLQFFGIWREYLLKIYI